MRTKVLDDVQQPDALTCQSAAICRVIGSTKVGAVRSALSQMGEPGDPAVMGKYMRPRVREYKYNGDASLNDAIAALRDGCQLITHGWFTGSGHVIGISGWDEKSRTFTVEDPWFEFDFVNWRYNYNGIGNDAPYSARGIYAACVVGQSPSDAYQIYLSKSVDYAARGMWLHMIKN